MQGRLSAIVGLLLVSAVGRAEEPPAPTHQTAPFWQAARHPNAQRVEALLRQGRTQLYPAMGLGLLLGADISAHRRAAIENALARFERARLLAPRNAEVLYLSAKAMGLWERRGASGKIERKSREAIARFEELRTLDPLYEAQDVAFELGVLYTREQNFLRAAAEYERALSLRIDDDSRGVLLGNLAEVTMMGDNLERSVELYERAIAEGSNDERLLALWGLSVALDRLGEHGEALERAREALREDQRPMGVLKQSSVFFVPAYESHYYDGIGYWAMAEEAAGERGQAEALARGYARAITNGASTGSLLALKQVLSSIDSEGHRAVVAPLYEVVERALKKVGRGKPQAKTKLLPAPDETALESREVKVVLYALQSLRSFLRYLDHGGAAGHWADDARAHIEELSTWFERKP